MAAKNPLWITALMLFVSAGFSLSVNGAAAATVKAKEPVLKPAVAEYPRKADEFKGAIVLDAKTGAILYSYQPDIQWPAASLSKLTAALVTVNHHQPWNKTVSLLKQDEVGGGRLAVKAGSRMTVQDMFYSSIVGSANNTTMSLARLSGLGVKGFVKQMNAEAKALGLKYTKFNEPTGLDAGNVTTPREMSKIALTAFSTPEIRKAASTTAYKFTITNPKFVHTVRNTDHLLTMDDDVWVIGGKTGYIDEAMYNFVVQMRPMDGGPQVLVVVMGAPTKNGSFASAKSLATWAWNAYDWNPSTVATALK